jgi:hypothetical protein
MNGIDIPMFRPFGGKMMRSWQVHVVFILIEMRTFCVDVAFVCRVSIEVFERLRHSTIHSYSSAPSRLSWDDSALSDASKSKNIAST